MAYVAKLAEERNALRKERDGLQQRLSEMEEAKTAALEQERAEQAALEAAGLRLGEVSSDYSSSPEGEVIWQEYSSNTQLKRGSSVKIKVSAGPKPTKPTTTETTTEEESSSETE